MNIQCSIKPASQDQDLVGNNFPELIVRAILIALTERSNIGNLFLTESLGINQ